MPFFRCAAPLIAVYYAVGHLSLYFSSDSLCQNTT